MGDNEYNFDRKFYNILIEDNFKNFLYLQMSNTCVKTHQQTHSFTNQKNSLKQTNNFSISSRITI